MGMCAKIDYSYGSSSKAMFKILESLWFSFAAVACLITEQKFVR